MSLRALWRANALLLSHLNNRTFTRPNGTICNVDDNAGIRRVTLNNPKQRNALSLEMMTALIQALEIDQNTRVVVIKSSGNVFSSGHNLKELVSSHGCASHEDIFRTCTKLMTNIQDISVPVIAQVQGLATAAGCQLVASCDLAVASSNAKFATPGVNIGLFCHTPGIAVARAVPRKIALDMLLTGTPISAEDALRFGLVSRVVSEEDLEQEVQSIAVRICESSNEVLSMGKRFFYSQIQQTRDHAYREGEQMMVLNLKHEDAEEGISAFIEKRKPNWKA